MALIAGEKSDRADAAAVENDRRLAVSQMPLRCECGEQVSDNEEIEEFEDEQRRQQSKGDPIAPIEWRRVEQRKQVVITLPRHPFRRSAQPQRPRFITSLTNMSAPPGRQPTADRPPLATCKGYERLKPSSSEAAQSMA